MAGELDLNAFMHRTPAVSTAEFGAKLLQLRLRRADDVAPPCLAQPCQILGAGHAAVGDPDAPQHAMPGLHGGHDRLQGPRIVGVAGEDLIAEGEAVKRHHQSNAHLRAVGAMIAGIAALRLRVRFGLAFKIGARDIVEQHVVVDREQLAAPLGQMRLHCRLVREQMIQPAIEPILVDLLIAELQQIAKRRAAIPVLGNVQLAGRFAKPSRHKHRRHLRPGDPLLAQRKQALAQLLKPHPAPQRERQVHVAKLARALDANAIQSNGRRQLFAAVIEQRRFFRRADQPARQRARLHTSVLVELAKMRDRLLDHPFSNTNAPHQTPIAMNLPVLPANRVAQVHAPSEPTATASKRPKVVTTRSNQPRAPSKYLIRLTPPCTKSRNPPPTCASWVSSSVTGHRLAAAETMTARPVAPEPVKIRWSNGSVEKAGPRPPHSKKASFSSGR